MGSGGQGSRAQNVVRVRRDLLASCMTCPLCHKLLRDATTVSECLHTFCRKCILDKITEEEVDSCPICHIDLGCIPAEKLRPDHNLQDIRNKVFPLKRRNSGTPEPPSLPLPARRKERSLSSLVVSSPRVSSQTGLTGRRTKPRRSVKSSANDENTSSKRAKVLDEEKPGSAPSRLVKSNRKHSNLDPETSTKDKENGREKEQQVDKSELWKPLNCLLEAATRKSLKSGSHTNEEEQNNNSNNDTTTTKSKPIKEEKQPLEEKNMDPSSAEQPMPAKRRKGIRRKKGRDIPAPALFDSISTVRDRRVGPVWFSLVATANREGGGQLPQLSSSYLRIRDGELTVSSIQKYIMTKLSLTTEEEVEIVCRGQPVGPTMTLHDLVDLWLRSETSNRTLVSVGSPAKDFIMVLAYRHRPSLLS
ncbi:Polycomb group RING finger protein 1 [Rhynchospora pubera]|uniref:Polycomb group RING finger protein 1 n=1 Tax=Rhynchospora pubera TaxID=906938 RepID=A0AAV8CDZ5_9POAL|nr:Polycomb group RING finger protein 1 [Rhynchospora pubera]